MKNSLIQETQKLGSHTLKPNKDNHFEFKTFYYAGYNEITTTPIELQNILAKSSSARVSHDIA